MARAGSGEREAGLSCGSVGKSSRHQPSWGGRARGLGRGCCESARSANYALLMPAGKSSRLNKMITDLCHSPKSDWSGQETISMRGTRLIEWLGIGLAASGSLSGCAHEEHEVKAAAPTYAARVYQAAP